MPKFRTKNSLFGFSWAIFLKNCGHILNQHPQMCLIAKFCGKQKCLNLGPKSLICLFFWVEFSKTIVIFEISTLKFVSLQSFEKKQKGINLGRKMPYWVFLRKNALYGYFRARILKKLLSYVKLAS